MFKGCCTVESHLQTKHTHVGLRLPHLQLRKKDELMINPINQVTLSIKQWRMTTIVAINGGLLCDLVVVYSNNKKLFSKSSIK
jgi:hypothetical protein